LVLKPDLLILDEPTKSLDTKRKTKLQAVLQDIWSQGTGIVIISHDREFVREFKGRNVQMVKGEVFCE
jgi:energy-coupling factor transport system ATP-binding protein